MAEFLAEAGEKLEIWRVSLSEIKEQEINARYMEPEMLERLSANIKKSKRLESIPFVVHRGDFFEMVSGHHRIRACRMAGLHEIVVLADMSKLTRSQLVAKQLAHNTLTGQDDRGVLQQLVAELETVEELFESFLDEAMVDIDAPALSELGNVQLDFDHRYMSFVFLASQVADMEELAKSLPIEDNTIGVVDVAIFGAFREAMFDLGRTDDIRSIGTMVHRMIEITNRYCAERRAESNEEE